ncbi:MAG: hypothetical protein AB7K78_12620, partial [Xanthobacteraceae bacterium]
LAPTMHWTPVQDNVCDLTVIGAVGDASSEQVIRLAAQRPSNGSAAIAGKARSAPAATVRERKEFK